MANTTIDKEKLAEMLDRFFAGETTNADDKALEEYFAGGDVPPEYECYRAMFGWYASGMDNDSLPAAPAEAVEARPGLRLSLRHLSRWGSAAAVVAVAVAFAWFGRPDKSDVEPLYTENYIVRDGLMITGANEIGDEIWASVVEGDCLEQEIDMNIRMLNKVNIAE